MTANTDYIPKSLHCLFTTKPNGRVIAHCLDFDLVLGADNIDDAEERLEALIKTFVEGSVFDSNYGAFSHTAPSSFWKEFQDAWTGGRTLSPANKTLTIRIKDPIAEKQRKIPLLFATAA